MNRATAWPIRITFLSALAVLAACSGNSNKDVPLETFGPEQIYERAEYDLETGEEEEAARLFGEVERLYPYSEWAKRALIMQAFAYHRNKDYENSRIAAQRFIDFYPAEEDVAYAQFLLALSYYDQIDAVGRDQGLTYQALQQLRLVIERHPDSEYARSAILMFDLAFDHLAAKEMEIGRYYLKRGHYTAAISRFRVVVEDFQTTSHTPEALHRLAESYLALGFTEESRTAAAVLGFNFRSSGWYEDSFEMLSGQGLEPGLFSDNWMGKFYRQTVRGEWL